MSMPAVLTMKVLFTVSAMLDILEMDLIVQILTNVHTNHVIIMLVVLTMKVPLTANALMDLLVMELKTVQT